MKFKESGAITSPVWTYSGKYNATYGKNANKNLRSFKTLAEAKRFLKSKNVEKATYKNSTGNIKEVNLNKKPVRKSFQKTQKVRNKSPFGFNFGF